MDTFELTIWQSIMYGCLIVGGALGMVIAFFAYINLLEYLEEWSNQLTNYNGYGKYVSVALVVMTLVAICTALIFFGSRL